MAIYFLFLFKGFSRVHYLPLVVYPHTNQPQPTQPITNQQQPRHTLTRSLILLSYFIISSLYPITAIVHATRSPLSSYMLIYNIIYLSTILYPISYLTSYTRAIISKRQPTARPDTLYRYIPYIFIHIKTSARQQIRHGNSWR